MHVSLILVILLLLQFYSFRFAILQKPIFCDETSNELFVTFRALFHR